MVYDCFTNIMCFFVFCEYLPIFARMVLALLFIDKATTCPESWKFLVGGLEHFLFFHRLGIIIIPTDSFFRGVGQPPTRFGGWSSFSIRPAMIPDLTIWKSLMKSMVLSLQKAPGHSIDTHVRIKNRSYTSKHWIMMNYDQCGTFTHIFLWVITIN